MNTPTLRRELDGPNQICHSHHSALNLASRALHMGRLHSTVFICLLTQTVRAKSLQKWISVDKGARRRSGTHVAGGVRGTQSGRCWAHSRWISHGTSTSTGTCPRPGLVLFQCKQHSHSLVMVLMWFELNTFCLTLQQLHV